MRIDFAINNDEYLLFSRDTLFVFYYALFKNTN